MEIKHKAEFISVPTPVIVSLLNEAELPTSLSTKDALIHSYVSCVYFKHDYPQFKYKATYEKVKPNFIDKLLGRTRLKLIQLTNPVLGTLNHPEIKGHGPIDTADWNDVHCEFKRYNYKTWSEIYASV